MNMTVNTEIQAGYRNLVAEGDNLIVIQALHEIIQISLQIQQIINDILTWRHQNIQITSKHIFWEAKMTADDFLNLIILVHDRHY